jgi:2-succinyl-5-enolpyruvyl-6-hydroxy-3-cyclohexene-1-carboxylate synthase
VNPSTAFGVTFADELTRCGLREVVIAPGSRSTPLAMAFLDLERCGKLRLHVRVDERSASFTALGLAKASGSPAAVLCTSGTAAANFHPAVIEADESGVPLLVLTTDRPPELRATGANQAIDQIKLYGGAVRWFCEPGAPEQRPGAAAYWRSLACQAWAHAAGAAGGLPGPVHLNLALREPLVPDVDETPQPLPGRPDGQPWTRFGFGSGFGSGSGARPEAVQNWPGPSAAAPPPLELAWTERGIVVCGDGTSDGCAAALVELAEQAGWPVLAEPSSGARRGSNALSAYQYLLAIPEFVAAHRPDLIVSAGRPGLSRAQMAFLGMPDTRHVVVGQGPDRWADPQRAATDVAGSVRLTGSRDAAAWLDGWLRADKAARVAVDAVLDAEQAMCEPRLARDLASVLPAGALLWSGSSMPIRDLDCHMAARADIRVLASRGASGIDGTTSAAIGAALAHGGPSYALVGDLAFLHDTPGLAIGPREPRPDLCLIVVNNDGGGIFSTLEQADYDGFDRLFGTPTGAALHHLAAAFGVPYHLLDHPDDLAKHLHGNGLRIIEARTGRAAGAELRARLRDAAAKTIGLCGRSRSGHTE